MSTESAPTDWSATLDTAMAEMATDGVDMDAPVDDRVPQDGGQGIAPAKAVTTEPAQGPAAEPGTTSESDAGTIEPVAPTEPAEDPYAGAEPVTYTVDGQARTLDGFYRFPGEGILVPEDKVPQFQLIASRAEALDAQNRSLYQQTQQLSKLSTWTTQDADGKSQVLTGQDAIIAERVAHSRLAANFDTMVQVFRGNPLAMLATDDAGNVVWNNEALSNLLTKAELAELRAEGQVRTYMQGLSSQQEPAPAVDLAATAPAAVAHYVSQYKATGLTAEDRTMLEKAWPRYIRTANADDVKANPALKLGEQVTDPAFFELLQHQQSVRSSVATVAKTTEQATKFNAGQQKGLKPPVVPPKKPATPAHDPKARKSHAAAWDSVLESALSEMPA